MCSPDISKAIAENLRMQLTSDDHKVMVAGTTQNAEAYQLYLKGRYEYAKRNRDSYNRGNAYFEQAIALDPSYAMAYAGLAGDYASQALFGYLPPSEAYPKAIASAKKAIALDERSAEAHAMLAYSILYYEWNWTQSEQELHRALALDPNDAVAHRIYGLFLGTVRRFDEGIAEERRAEVLDPLTPPTALGFVLTEAHRYDDAVAALKRALELEPDSVLAHVFLADAYRVSKRGDLALAENRRAIELGFPFGQALLAASYAAAGRKAEAAALLKESIEQSKRSHCRSRVHRDRFCGDGRERSSTQMVGGVIQGARPGLMVVSMRSLSSTTLGAPTRVSRISSAVSGFPRSKHCGMVRTRKVFSGEGFRGCVTTQFRTRQRLKPHSWCTLYGTAEAVPYNDFAVAV